MFYQVKAIRKGVKPPVWRRILVPANITFAQMALLLETVLELPASDQFEFEFFGKKDRIIEWHEEDDAIHNYYYNYLHAPDTFVNGWFQNEPWFTFRLRDSGSRYPEYRVEIEKTGFGIRRNNDKTEEDLGCPVILKEVSKEEDLWTSPYKINETLQKEYAFCETESPDYLCLEELKDRMTKEQGLVICKKPADRRTHYSQSGQAMMQEFADQLKSVFEKKKFVLRDKVGFDDKTQEVKATEEECKEAVEEFRTDMESYLQELKDKEWPMITRGDIRRKEVMLVDQLKAYSKKDILEIAEDAGCKPGKGTKDRLAAAVANELLKPAVMKYRLLDAEEESLDAFEAALLKGCFTPSDDERDLLETISSLCYISEYKNGDMRVPSDVKPVYEALRADGYREYHKKAKWMIHCLNAFRTLYVVGSVGVLYRLYKREKSISADYEAFLSVYREIPDDLNPCTLIGEKVINKAALKNDIYKQIESVQRGDDYYIPAKEEILTISTDGYPSGEAAYGDLYRFFRDHMNCEEDLCRDLCREAFFCLTTGGRLSDYMDHLNEKEIIFESERQVHTFASIFMQVNNNTRMFDLKGHKPVEMRTHEAAGGGKQPTTIIPMSSLAADLLEQGRDSIQAMGFNVDTDAAAADIPVTLFPNGISGEPEVRTKKIYPNDPCPCGSGKKYKKCCGRK